MKKDSKWNWSTECLRAFEEMKNINVRRITIQRKIIVASDASNLGLGAVILYKESNGQVKAIAQMSRTLLPIEKE